MSKKLIFIFLLLFFIINVKQVFALTASDPTSIDQIYLTGDYSVSYGIGTATVDYRFWYYYPSASHNICSVTIDMAYAGTPTDSIQLGLYYNTIPGKASSTLISDLNLITVQMADSSWQLSNSGTNPYTYTFTPCAVVTGIPTSSQLGPYVFKLQRTGSSSDTNHYYINGGSIGDGNTRYYNGTGEWRTGTVFPGGSSHNNPTTHTGYNIKINGTENFSAFQPPGSSTTTLANISGCSDSGAIAGSLCYVFNYLFVPAQSVFDQFSNVKTLLEGKFPFAYYYDFQVAFDNVYNSDEFNLPNYTYTATGTAITGITIDTYSSVVDTIGTDNFNLLRIVLQSVIWFLVGSYVFFRIKNLIHS